MQFEFVQTNKGTEKVWKRRRLRRTDDVRLKEYAVFTEINGVRTCIGKVGQLLTTFEQRTPGRQYVNRRWQSPRWYWAAGDEHLASFRQVYSETRKEATERLVYHAMGK